MFVFKFSERKQPRVKKSKRKKPDKDTQLYPYIPISNDNDQYYGKRKRSTTITQNTYEPTSGSQMSNYTVNKLKKNEFNDLTMQCDFDKGSKIKLTKFVQQNENKMELDDEQEDSTSLSEESNLSDPRFHDVEADDEQSDYYEVSNFQRKNNNRRQYGRTSLDKKASNLFSPLSPSTSSVLWKRRRRNLPNNHFN